MLRFSKTLPPAATLVMLTLFLISCQEQELDFENQKVQFSLIPAATHDGRMNAIELPENARARISVAGSNGASVLTDHEIAVFKTAEGFVTDGVELTPGTYHLTDFIILSDSVGLYVAPRKEAEIQSPGADALPFQFSVGANKNATVGMRVVDVRRQDLQKFGYASGNPHVLSLSVYQEQSLTSATAELYQSGKLLKTLSLTAEVNTIRLGGNHKLPYTLTVYTANGATTQTFDIRELKKQLGKNPLKLALAPALIFTMHSYVDEGNEYEEYYTLRMEGTGSVNINWGDGEQGPASLPFEAVHEYTVGNYTAIITGDLDKITNFSGFSYGTIMYAIKGLTNLTALKVYDPSWGAVPIKVDLSNCRQLERINIAKYGAPYEPIDLRTDFKLPTEHNIHSFIFDAPSFDSNREFISAAELEVMISNIYNNVLNRDIHDGDFYIYPVEAPSAQTQQKINVLQNEYHWGVGLNEIIYEEYGSGGRSADDADARREQWLREHFQNSEQIISRAKVAMPMN